MKPLARATWILFQAHFWRVFRTWRGLIAGLLAAFPVALALLVRFVSKLEGPAPLEVLVLVAWGVLINALVPIVSLVVASSVIAEEIEDRTITYLFTRPIPRPAILFGRWAAVALPIAALLCLAAELVVQIVGGLQAQKGSGEWMPAGFHARMLVTVLMGSLVYSAGFAALGALVKRPMIVGLGYVLIFEGLLGNLPGSTQKGTVVFYLRSFLLGPHPELGGELSELLFATPPATPFEAVRSLALILVALLALGAWRFSRREYVLAA